MYKISELEQHVIDHLRQVIFILKKRLSDQPTFAKLSSPQLNALIHLEKNQKSTVTALAKEEGISIQSMGVTVNSLKQQGLIIATPDPNDKRKTLLSLSEQCQAEVTAFKRESDLWLAEKIREQLNIDEQKVLLHGVELLQKIL
ncbi:MarR family winged helix-turn-helix transcriptional regulator [Acinetobacter sp. HY1485]|uniref:MarR family winged helix-turn-helix transcriptional regulator n=1 Tax=Acinetobacter sp. HY1485 TaxID=2970918 RepID=UPI0022B9B9E2|nr:helix-turn-helix domain-containing protein [Acinetobacter sp. HY1485]